MQICNEARVYLFFTRKFSNFEPAAAETEPVFKAEFGGPMQQSKFNLKRLPIARALAIDHKSLQKLEHNSLDPDGMQEPARAARKISTRLGCDERADGGRRTVVLDPTCVIISRRVDGMRMHVHVPLDHFEEVSIVCEDRPEGALYRIRLFHRDPELCVVLTESRDEAAVLAAWSEWSAFFAASAPQEAGRDPLAGEFPASHARADAGLAGLPPPRPGPKRRARRGGALRGPARRIAPSES